MLMVLGCVLVALTQSFAAVAYEVPLLGRVQAPFRMLAAAGPGAAHPLGDA